jgi:hypothetical protein
MFLSRFAHYIQNVKLRNRNKHKRREIVRNRKSNKMNKNAAKFRARINFHE